MGRQRLLPGGHAITAGRAGVLSRVEDTESWTLRGTWVLRHPHRLDPVSNAHDPKDFGSQLVPATVSRVCHVKDTAGANGEQGTDCQSQVAGEGEGRDLIVHNAQRASLACSSERVVDRNCLWMRGRWSQIVRQCG